MAVESIKVTVATPATSPTSVIVGVQGPSGPQGAAGVAGATGATGAAGATGPAGSSGANGTQILSGTIAPTDGLGQDGDYYLDTSNGDLYTHGGSTGWNFSLNIRGPTGPQGPTGATGATGPTGDTGPAGSDGNRIYTGTGAPSDSLGVDGDLYVDAATGGLYEHGGSTGWNFSGTLRGLQGPQGETGQTGAAGATGAQGTQGATGPQGPAGAGGIEILVDSTLGASGVPGLDFTGSDFAISYNSDGSANISSKMKLAVANPASGDKIQYNGTAWVNQAFRGALVKKAADQTGANYSGAGANVAWTSEAYDHGEWHDNVTNNSRLTVPSGVTKVRVWSHIRINNMAADTFTGFGILKNGSSTYDGKAQTLVETGSTSVDITIMTPVLEVTAGDYFEALLFTESDTSIDVIAGTSSFGIEAVE